MRFLGLIPQILCAVVLFVAAALKSYQLLNDPALGTLYGSRLAQLLQIEFEVLLATWLLSGFAPLICRRVLLFTFAAFGCYTLYLGLTGADSCGCFGRAQISPWWTCALDGAVLLLLWQWKPSVVSPRKSKVLSAAAFPVVVGVALIAALAMQPSTATADGIVVADKFVVLEPEKWIGKPFPLFEHIETGEDLRHGTWKLLFYHHDCPTCQEVLAGLPKDGRDASQALIEIPPFGAESAPKGFLHGRLRPDADWFVASPVQVTLGNGRVVAVALQSELLTP